MKKAISKIACAVLSLSLLTGAASTTAVPVSAESAGSSDLEEAVLRVKSQVYVPDSLTEFDYYYSTQYVDGETVGVWNFNWSDGDNLYISVQTDSLGNLNSYYKGYDYNVGLAKYNISEGKAKADAFIKKALPDIADNLRAEDTITNSFSPNYSYTYYYYHNDIPVRSATFTVRVNKYSGEVVNYDGLGVGESLPQEFEGGEAISAEEAKAAYLEHIGLKLGYSSSYYYSNQTVSTFPAYNLEDTYSVAIDAESGDPLDIWYPSYGYADDYSYARDTMYGEAALESGSSLTAAEQEAVDTVAGLISKEQALGYVKKAIGDTSLTIRGATFEQNYLDANKYIWNLTFANGHGSVDAKTGELLTYYDYSQTSGEKKLTSDEALKIAEEFIKTQSPEKASQSKLHENNRIEAVAYSAYPLTYTFTFYRQVNGIDYDSNFFSVQVGQEDGAIRGYVLTWYDNVEFADISSAIAMEEAFNIFNEDANFSLAYVKTSATTATLVYTFANSVYYAIDPLSGERINSYDGSPYTESDVPRYTDIDGHEIEGIITELLENGYYLEGSEFKPEENITQMDFFNYIYTGYYGGDESSMYNYLQMNGIVTEKEWHPQGELQKQDAARFLVRILGLGRAAELDSIYVNNFTDNVNSEYVGAAVLSCELGLLKADESGAFNGTDYLTRADTAQIVYNLIKVQAQ